MKNVNPSKYQINIIIFIFHLAQLYVMGETEAHTDHTHKLILILQTHLTYPKLYINLCPHFKNNWSEKAQLKNAFWKHKSGLLQFLNSHTKCISGLLSILFLTSIWENSNFCFREKRIKQRSLSLLCCILPALQSPIT